MLKNIFFIRSELQRIEGLKKSLIVKLENEPNEFGEEMLDFYNIQITQWEEIYKQHISLFISKHLTIFAFLLFLSRLVVESELPYIFGNACFFLVATLLFVTAQEKVIRISASLTMCLSGFSTALSIYTF